MGNKHEIERHRLFSILPPRFYPPIGKESPWKTVVSKRNILSLGREGGREEPYPMKSLYLFNILRI